MRNAITGANEADKHYVGVNLERDFQIADSRFADLRNASAGDPCPRLRNDCRWNCGTRSRSATFSSWARNTPRRSKQNSRRSRAAAPHDHGLLRHRRESHHRLAGRNQPRRERHHLAAVARSLRSDHHAAQRQRRRRHAGGRAAVSRNCKRPGSTCCWTIAISAPASSSKTPADLIGIPLPPRSRRRAQPDQRPARTEMAAGSSRGPNRFRWIRRIAQDRQNWSSGAKALLPRHHRTRHHDRRRRADSLVAVSAGAAIRCGPSSDYGKSTTRGRLHVSHDL